MSADSPSDDLPGEPISAWLATTPDAGYDPLATPIEVDVAVVGGGITGLSTAASVRDRGRSVAVVERDRLVSGTTGKTTAKLTSQHGLIYDHLRREFGRERARQYARVQERAIDAVEERVREGDLECGFERRPAYVYGDDRDAFEREADAAQAAELPASFVTSVPPFDRAECGVRFDDQACFHPRKYLLAVAEELSSRSGVELFEHTRVTDVDPGSPCRLETTVSPGPADDASDDGDAGAETTATVTADSVVLATGFPILDRAGYFARLSPKRSYVLGMRIDGDYPEGMYYRTDDPYRSVRTHRDEDGPLLLVGGENHKTGQGGSAADRYRRLARWARERFSVRSIDYRWSTQDYVPADGVPLVGRAGVGAENVSVATGFRGWGMTNGIAAGESLAAAIDGESPPELDLFDPLRFTPKTSLGDAVTENADAASQFATDWLRTLLSPAVESIDRGEGRVLREGSRPVAVSRDADGDVHAVSAVCTHMRCLVSWNDGEESWDCPCHGSRFDVDGSVLEGPATEDLPSRGGE